MLNIIILLIVRQFNVKIISYIRILGAGYDARHQERQVHSLHIHPVTGLSWKTPKWKKVNCSTNGSIWFDPGSRIGSSLGFSFFRFPKDNSLSWDLTALCTVYIGMWLDWGSLSNRTIMIHSDQVRSPFYQEIDTIAWLLWKETHAFDRIPSKNSDADIFPWTPRVRGQREYR